MVTISGLTSGASRRAEAIERVILTASGGPFRDRNPKTFGSITPQEALDHPNRSMGARITTDGHSATVYGQERLTGGPVMASDLRASARLFFACSDHPRWRRPAQGKNM